MAIHPLICAELGRLAARLPPEVVEELADGLLSGYDQHRAAGLAPEEAARATLAEFGDAATVARAFVQASPGARAARILLASGPIVGALWGSALLAEAAWRESFAGWARVSVGVALVSVVAALLLAAGLRCTYQRTSMLALAGACGLLGLDGLMLLAAMSAPLDPSWLLAAAIAAGLARMLVTLRELADIVTRP